MNALKRFLLAALAAVVIVTPSALPAFAQADQALNTPVDVAAVSVLVTATKLLSGVTVVSSVRYRGFWLNPTNGEIAVGGPSVTSTTGVLVATGEKVFIPWTYGQGWYAIRTGASNVDVRVLPVK